MAIFQNSYSAYVYQNQQQYHLIPADPQYVQGPVQFIYPSNRHHQQPRPFNMPMGHPAFQGGPMPFQAFNSMQMTMQTHVVVQSLEPKYCVPTGQFVFDQNQCIIDRPQPQMIPSNVSPNQAAAQSVIPNGNTNQVKSEPHQDHCQLRQALQLKYNPYNKPDKPPSNKSTPSTSTSGKFWDREMSEEETKWAFEGINDLSYLGDPEFRRLVFSLPK